MINKETNQQEKEKGYFKLKTQKTSALTVASRCLNRTEALQDSARLRDAGGW